MVSATHNKLITLYHDKSYIEVRNIYSDAATTASEFLSPILVNTPRQGCNCSCFNSDQSILYFVDNSFYLMAYDIQMNSLSMISSVSLNFGFVIDCYFDEVENSLFLVKPQYQLKKFDLNKLKLKAQQITGSSSFDVDASNRYLTMHQGGVILIYQLCHID